MTIVSKRKGIEVDFYVFDVLLPDLVGHDHRPATFALYMWLWAMTRGAGRKAAYFSYQTLADRTGLSKSAVQRAAAWLEKRQLIAVKRKSPTAVPEYAVLTPWDRGR